MRRAGQQLLGFFLAFGALAVAGAVILPRLLGLAAGPEAEMTAQIKRSERSGGDLPGLRSTRCYYDRITVQVQDDRQHALATATLDYDGQLEPTRVSSLGFEEIHFTLKQGDWTPDAGLAPRLSSTVAALEARRRSLEKGDSEAREALNRLRADPLSHPNDRDALERLWRVTERRYRAVSWFIREERGKVTVTERYRLTGGTAEAPVDEQAMVQLRLVQRGREFFFVSGLM